MWCQKSMENTPATLNSSEKARKYHFLPRKSMLGLRKNSTELTPYQIYDFVNDRVIGKFGNCVIEIRDQVASGFQITQLLNYPITQFLNAQCFSALLAGQ